MEGQHELDDEPPSRFTHLIVALVALLILLAIAAYGPVLHYYEGKDGQFVGAAGILLAFYGLGLSVAGFGFTWMQLARTQGAAEAAKDAVKKLKSAFGSFDTLLELSTAKTNADECRRMLAETAWPLALQSYHRIRSSLLKMSAGRSDIDADLMSRLKDAQAAVTGAILDLERKAREPDLLVDATSLSATLLAMDELFVELEQQLRDNFSGN